MSAMASNKASLSAAGVSSPTIRTLRRTRARRRGSNTSTTDANNADINNDKANSTSTSPEIKNRLSPNNTTNTTNTATKPPPSACVTPEVRKTTKTTTGADSNKNNDAEGPLPPSTTSGTPSTSRTTTTTTTKRVTRSRSAPPRRPNNNDSATVEQAEPPAKRLRPSRKAAPTALAQDTDDDDFDDNDDNNKDIDKKPPAAAAERKTTSRESSMRIHQRLIPIEDEPNIRAQIQREQKDDLLQCDEPLPGDYDDENSDTVTKLTRQQLQGNQTFEKHFLDFLVFQKVYGHSLVPKYFAEHPALGRWCARVRTWKSRGNTHLTKSRQARLDRAGFCWKAKQSPDFWRVQTFCRQNLDQWEAHFRELQVYHSEHGNCLVPKECRGKYRPLARWVTKIRKEYRIKQQQCQESHTLTDEREQRLRDLGFIFNTKHSDCVKDIFLGRYQANWDEYLARLEVYRSQHGHCRIPRRYPQDQPLASWVIRQRSQYRKMQAGMDSYMNEERIQKLKAINFCFVGGRTYGKKAKVDKDDENDDVHNNNDTKEPAKRQTRSRRSLSEASIDENDDEEKEEAEDMEGVKEADDDDTEDEQEGEEAGEMEDQQEEEEEDAGGTGHQQEAKEASPTAATEKFTASPALDDASETKTSPALRTPDDYRPSATDEQKRLEVEPDVSAEVILEESKPSSISSSSVDEVAPDPSKSVATKLWDCGHCGQGGYTSFVQAMAHECHCRGLNLIPLSD